MAEYSRVAKQLAAVRRAWKRTAALSGLAVTCLETLGVLTVAFLIDWIYSPPPMWRCAILAGVVVAVAALLVRHVVRPIAKKISDDQVAMFVEEHNDKFEGSLITATEFAGPAARSEAPAFFIDAVIASAIQRAHQVSIRSILDFRRLRKYGFAALAVLAGYGVMAVFAPDYVTQHMKRVIAPWKVRAEDQRVLDQATLMKMPITFTLSRGHSSILRGSNFELEAVLSRHSDDPVSLNFKSAGTAGNWRVLPMTEIEKLNAFTGTLKDINEDMEFFASSGSHRSETFKISVFDPLVVQSVELRTQYPAYLQLPDKVEVRSENVGIDVAAPEASKVTLRITANRPIVSGQVSLAAIESGDRQQLPVTAEKGQPVAVASFEVKQDGTYEYEIADSVGQKARSSVRGDIRILKDGPPTMEVRRPLNGATPVPIGEVSFLVSATDDLAMAGVEVFYERQFPDASKEPGVPVKTQAGKFPLQLKHLTSGSFPDTTEATGRMLLETLDPPCQPEEIISFYVEGTDRKGQKVVSELQTIAVMHYENWVEADVKPPHEPTFTIQKDIEEYVKMAWQMHQAREKVAKAELAKQCSDIADSMKNESKQFYPFYNPKKIPPDKKHHAHKADEYIAKGYDALKAVNTGDAVADFRVAAAELKICGIGNLDKMQMFSADFNKPGNQKEKELKKLFEKIMVEGPSRRFRRSFWTNSRRPRN